MVNTVGILQFALNGVTAQESAIAGNLANDQTPGYRAEQVTFQASLAAALANGGTASVTETTSDAPVATDGNNVDLTTQVVGAEEAVLQFQTLTESMNDQFALIQEATGAKGT